MARAGFVLLALLVAIQTLPGLWSRDFAAGDEVRHADALRNLEDGGHWAVLRMNGKPYPDKPPVYFWLVGGLSAALGSREAPVWFLAAALSGLALLGAAWSLARATGAPRDAAPLAGLLLLATPLFVILTRTTRSDALFSALIVLSFAWLYRGLSTTNPSRWTVLGGLAASIATLVKGPLGLAFPAVGVLVWLAREKRLARLLRPDVLGAAFAALAPIVGWVIAVRAVEGGEFLRRLWEEQILGRAFGSSAPHAKPFWFYAAVLPLVVLPWTLLLLAAPWKDRAPEDAPSRSASRFLWCQVLAGLVLLSLFRSKFENYLLPLLSPLAVLAGSWLLRAPPERLRRAWWGIGAAGILLAIALVVASDRLPSPFMGLAGLVPTAIAFGATGLAVLLAARGPALRPVWIAAAGVSVTVAIASVLVGPSLDPILSPRAQAHELARRIDAGADALAYRVYPGTYSWHAARTIRETDDLQEVVRFLTTHGAVVVATPRKYVDRNPEVFAGMDVVHEQWIDGQTHLLLVRPGGDR